jgi:hypothetical protein
MPLYTYIFLLFSLTTLFERISGQDKGSLNWFFTNFFVEYKHVTYLNFTHVLKVDKV